jgi:hypothetical protein
MTAVIDLRSAHQGATRPEGKAYTGGCSLAIMSILSLGLGVAGLVLKSRNISWATWPQGAAVGLVVVGVLGIVAGSSCHRRREDQLAFEDMLDSDYYSPRLRCQRLLATHAAQRLGVTEQQLFASPPSHARERLQRLQRRIEQLEAAVESACRPAREVGVPKATDRLTLATALDRLEKAGYTEQNPGEYQVDIQFLWEKFDQLEQPRSEFDELYAQFHGFPAAAPLLEVGREIVRDPTVWSKAEPLLAASYDDALAHIVTMLRNVVATAKLRIAAGDGAARLEAIAEFERYLVEGQLQGARWARPVIQEARVAAVASVLRSGQPPTPESLERWVPQIRRCMEEAVRAVSGRRNRDRRIAAALATLYTSISPVQTRQMLRRSEVSRWRARLNLLWLDGRPSPDNWEHYIAEVALAVRADKSGQVVGWIAETIGKVPPDIAPALTALLP